MDKVKVLLVDDEKLERVLIRKGFRWEENGFEIVGEAESGQDGLEFLKNRKVDMVVTDICMPNMTGLELSEIIAEKYPDCYIVIVTGYRDFEYARQAVKIGVEDFLLKPVNIDDIKKVAEKIKKKIAEKNKRYGEVQKLKESLFAESDVIRESFLNQLVENRILEEKAIPKLNIYGYEKIAESCCCINISICEEAGKIEISDNHDIVLEYLRHNMPKECVIFVHFMHNIIVFLANGHEYMAKKYAGEILEVILKEKIEAVIGISDVKKGFTGISEAYHEAKDALRASVLLGENRIIEYQEYCDMMNNRQPLPRFPWEEFSFALTNLLNDKVEQMLHEYFIIMENVYNGDMEYLRLMIMDILSKAGTTLSGHGTDLFQLAGEEQLFNNIRMVQNMEESQEIIKQNINIVLEYHEKKKKKQKNRVVDEALDYINENCCNPDLTLKSIAEKVFSNESYLSRVFKREVGNSVIEYITKKRIEESIRLLNTTDLKVYEIAEKVGFRDSHYFSICFKKQVGLTVKEFKNR